MNRSKKFRLAVFTNRFPGLVNTFFARDIRSLLDAGFDIDIFAFYPLEPKLWRYVPELLNEDLRSRIGVHHVGFFQSLTYLKPWPPKKFGRFLWDTMAITASAASFGIIPVSKSLYVFPKAYAWSRTTLMQYDHVVAYWGNYAATCAYLFHRLRAESVPFSIFLHAGIDLYEDQVFLPKKLLHADNIITVCEFNRRFIKSRFAHVYPLIADKIYKHHLGLDLEGFPYHPNGRPTQRIVAVGTLSEYKGYEYLLRAVAELRARGVACELELVGDGPQADFLKQLTNALSIADRVRFSGWLPPSKVRAAMENATVFVHPSQGIGDAVPTVIKESMALGTPVIASRLAGIPELLDEGRCGILVPPADAGAIADAIQQLLRSDDLRQRYARAARRFAEEQFDLRRNGEQLAQLLRSTKRKETVAGKSGRLVRVTRRSNEPTVAR